MTRLGEPIPTGVIEIRDSIIKICKKTNFIVVDAATEISGRDFLLKIWKQIAAVPLAVAICHKEIPQETQSNIYYELGVAQAMGKETIIVKSPDVKIPSDFIRTEYIEFKNDFFQRFFKYISELDRQAEFYELMADQLENNPVLSLDYLKRAFLISGNTELRIKMNKLLRESGLDNRAKNSVEQLIVSFLTNHST